MKSIHDDAASDSRKERDVGGSDRFAGPMQKPRDVSIPAPQRAGRATGPAPINVLLVTSEEMRWRGRARYKSMSSKASEGRATLTCVEQQPMPQTGARVLVVEDDDRDFEILCRTAGSLEGLVLTRAASLTQAISKIAERAPDIILLDLHLPESDGLETVDAIRKEAPNSVIVVLSGLADDVVALQAVARGVQDYLVKGEMSRRVLTRALNRSIVRHEHRRALARERDLERFRATHDELTSLPNRGLLHEHLQTAIARAKRHEHGVAIAFLDLDGFKPINDTHGHQLGDTVLRVVADRLKKALRASDCVARWGGDEFIVVAEITDAERDVPLLLQRVTETVNTPIVLAGQDVQVQVSVGVSVYPNDGEVGQSLIELADERMYTGKAAQSTRRIN